MLAILLKEKLEELIKKNPEFAMENIVFRMPSNMEDGELIVGKYNKDTNSWKQLECLGIPEVDNTPLSL